MSRSYVVETPDGVHYRRNRKDLLKTEENISGELDLEMTINETQTQIPLKRTLPQKEHLEKYQRQQYSCKGQNVLEFNQRD